MLNESENENISIFGLFFVENTDLCFKEQNMQTTLHPRLPVLCNSISAFLENGNYNYFYFLPQVSMFSDDTLCITVKPHKVNPDQDVPPTYVQVPAASTKTFTFYIPNCLSSQSLWWDFQENTNVHFYIQVLNLQEILQAKTVMKFSVLMPSGRISEKQA